MVAKRILLPKYPARHGDLRVRYLGSAFIPHSDLLYISHCLHRREADKYRIGLPGIGEGLPAKQDLFYRSEKYEGTVASIAGVPVSGGWRARGNCYREQRGMSE